MHIYIVERDSKEIYVKRQTSKKNQRNVIFCTEYAFDCVILGVHRTRMIRKPKTFETVFETKFERTMTSKETSEAIALIEENFKSCESTKTDKRKGSVHHTRIVLGLNVLNRRIEELEMVIMVRVCSLSFSFTKRLTRTTRSVQI